MPKKLIALLPLFVIAAVFSVGARADLAYIGEGVRQNTVVFSFDSYKVVHYASSYSRSLSYDIERSLHLTMLSEWGTFFTKDRMVEALVQALEANVDSGELNRMAGELNRFEKTLLSLPINKGSELHFNHIPGLGLQIQMKGGRGLVKVFESRDQAFSIAIMKVWLGRAHPSANNRDSLERLIENLWKYAQ